MSATMTDSMVRQVKEQLIQASRKLSASGVLFRGEHANLSAKMEDGRIVMTRGGNISNLNMDSFSLVNLDGSVVEGEMDPTTAEVIHMHTAVYCARDSVGSIIHTHAPNATVFAIAQQSIPAVYEPLLRFGISEDIPVVPWAPRGSEQSVNGIVEIVKHRPGVSAVLLANHGVLAFSASTDQTAQLLATLDEAAELIIKARMIGGEKPLPEEAFMQVRSRMEQFGSRR